MPPKDYDFQPGAILHDAIVGTFKANGGSFELWCRENGISPSLARVAEPSGDDGEGPARHRSEGGPERYHRQSRVESKRRLAPTFF